MTQVLRSTINVLHCTQLSLTVSTSTHLWPPLPSLSVCSQSPLLLYLLILTCLWFHCCSFYILPPITFSSDILLFSFLPPAAEIHHWLGLHLFILFTSVLISLSFSYSCKPIHSAILRSPLLFSESTLYLESAPISPRHSLFLFLPR